MDFARDVQPIFNRSCSCHTTLNPQGGLVLKEGLSYGALVSVASAERPLLLLVKPAAPGASYLFLKIDTSSASQALRSGDLMPRGLSPLGAQDVETIRKWIAEGAAPAAAKGDTTPPVFDGASSAAAAGPFAVDLSWNPASDDRSPPTEISYLVYRAASPGGQDFSAPDLITSKGALSARVEGLQPETTYFFVARALDDAGNHDGNKVEVSATTPEAPPPPTGIDFDAQVLPILRKNCLRCHGGDSGGICPGAAGLCTDTYASLSRTAINGRVIIAGDSADSVLVARIRGDVAPRMPADGPPFLTGEEIQLIESWIDEGAKRLPPQEGNRPPVASAGGPYAGYPNEAIAFASPDAYDPDGDALTFSWDFGDGTVGDGRFSWHAYGRDGLYTATVKANDGRADSQVSSASVTVRAVTGDVPKNATLARVCSRCHGIRITLEDGRRGQAAPPGQGFGFFPPGITLDARARTTAAWDQTVIRMLTHGAAMSAFERAEIVSFLRAQYGTEDGRSALFLQKCGGCHTAALAMAVPRSVAMWRETVDRMVFTELADIQDLERWSIAGYLGEVMEGPPPAALDPPLAHIFLNRQCSTTCHSVQRFVALATGLPRADFFGTYDGARAIMGRMSANKCGQKGVMETIAARRLSEISSQIPDLLSIDLYQWDAATGHLTVLAFSSSLGVEKLTLLTEDGRSLLLDYRGNGIYGKDVEKFSLPPPGRISIRSSGNTYLSWFGPIPQ